MRCAVLHPFREFGVAEILTLEKYKKMFIQVICRAHLKGKPSGCLTQWNSYLITDEF